MSRANPRFRRTNPALPAVVPNVVQLTLFYTLESQVCINNLYYFDGGATASIANLTAFLSGWNTAHQATLLAAASNDTLYVQSKAQYLNVPAIIPQYLAAASGSIGTGGAGHQPTVVAVVLSKASNIKGQSGRGRFYTVGVPPAAVTGSALNTGAAFYTALNTLTVHIVNTLTVGAINYIPGIFSRRGYNKISGLGGGFSSITNVYIRTTLGTVRRRRLGRGK